MLSELFLLIDFTKIIVFGKIVGECGEKSILHPLPLKQMNASHGKFRRKVFVRKE